MFVGFDWSTIEVIFNDVSSPLPYDRLHNKQEHFFIRAKQLLSIRKRVNNRKRKIFTVKVL